ncbi:hypothetical protein B0H14DRAFT_3892335, partial [Mycena olivaceomarginata]
MGEDESSATSDDEGLTPAQKAQKTPRVLTRAKEVAEGQRLTAETAGGRSAKKKALKNKGVGMLTGNDVAGNMKTGTFVIYSPHEDRPKISDDSFTTDDLTCIQANLGIGGLMSIHQPAEAVLWIEDNWDNHLLTSIRNSGCGGPFAWMLSPEEPALAIFGYYHNPTIVNMAQSLADSSGFPVVIRPSDDNPALKLLAPDADPQNVSVQLHRTTGNDNERRSDNEGQSDGDGANQNGSSAGDSGNGGRRAEDLGGGGPGLPGGGGPPDGGGPPSGAGPHGGGDLQGAGSPQGGGDGGGDGNGGGPPEVDGKWESPLHRTRVELQLKLSTQTYE